MNIEAQARLILRAIAREVQDAIKKCAEAIHITNEEKRDKEPPPDKPIQVRAVVSFDEETIAAIKPKNDGAQATQDSIKKAAWSTFAAVSIYALITVLMWCAMLNQNTIASRALSQTEKQWRSQQAPLLGIENNAISIAPGIHFAWTPVLPTPTIYVGPVSYVIKNFGAGMALHEWDLVHILPNPDGRKPDALLTTMCSVKPSTTREAAEGQFILPGAEIHTGQTTTIGRTPTDMHIVSLWIEVCLSYEDQWKTVHHSRFVYMTIPGPGNGSGAITPIPSHPEWTYVPIKGLSPISAETDYGENPN